MLSTTSEYAIQALTFLSRLDKGESFLGRDLSEMSGIPANYLSKILVALRRAGFLEATRGPGGGYRLKVPPGKIKLMDVVRTIEGESAVPSCILRHKRMCSDEAPCAAHAAWSEVKDAYIGFLQSTTVGSIAAEGTQRRIPGAGKGRTGSKRGKVKKP